jgi:ATP-binding protein involved in chromosome partitioning
VAIDGVSPAAHEFQKIARLIIDEVAPPVNMAGCSARMLSMVAAALDAADQPKSA